MAALEKGGLKHTSKDFGNTVYAVLSREQGKTGEIVRVNNAWGLSEWYPGLRRKNINSIKTVLVPTGDESTDYEGAKLNPPPK